MRPWLAGRTVRSARYRADEGPAGIAVRGEAQVSAAQVLVVGAVNVDLVVAVDQLPGPGETVVGPRAESYGGGKGANAAVAAARAGAAVQIIGAIGKDAAGADAERDLTNEGIDCTGLARLEHEPTGTALIVVDRSGENQIAVGAGANSALTPDWVAGCVAVAADEADCVLVSTEIPGPAVLAAVSTAAARDVACILNPAPPIEAVVHALTYRPILTPNRVELKNLLAMLAEREPDDMMRFARDSNDVAEQAKALAAVSRAPVVVTLGASGMLTVDSGRAVHHPAPEVAVRDATGAGDTFNGVLATWLAAGRPLTEAARAAMTAASLSVSELGARTGMPLLAQINAAAGELLSKAHRS